MKKTRKMVRSTATHPVSSGPILTAPKPQVVQSGPIFTAPAPRVYVRPRIRFRSKTTARGEVTKMTHTSAAQLEKLIKEISNRSIFSLRGDDSIQSQAELEDRPTF